MSLKFSDALRLSWSNIAQHKKRSAILVVTIALLFGLVMGFNFLTSGIEETTIAAAAGQTGGEVYMEASYGKMRGGGYDDETYIHSAEELAEVSLAPVLDEEADQKVRERAAEYGGEVVGYYWIFQLDFPYRVIEKSAVEQFIDEGLWETRPEGKVPVLMPEGWEPPEVIESLAEGVDEVWYRVGSIPATEAGSPTLEGANPLNLILAQLSGEENDDFWLVDDGSGEVERYLRAQIERELAGGGSYAVAPMQKIAVVKFSDSDQAAAFATPEQGLGGIALYTDFQYRTQDLFGTTLSVVSSFNMQRVLLLAAGVVLLIVATLIAVMSFAHLIDQDAATVALYRAMGASTGDIYLVYFLYLVELCLLAMVATVVIAFGLIAGLAVTSVGALAERLQEFYGLMELPQVALFRLNGAFWAILVVILAVAPLTLVLTMRRFSAKHLAKKMKED